MNATLKGREKCSYLDEAELITRTQNGDTEAFTPIVLMYRERIYNSFTDGFATTKQREDLCQEVFLKAWQALPRSMDDL